MNNAQINTKFLAVVDAATKTAILENIAKHYGISEQEAFEEVTDEYAEHLIDYIDSAPMRKAASVLFKRHGL